MIFAFDDFELDAERLELRRGGRVIKANRTALLTLACLVRSAGRLVTKDELVQEVWEGRAVADTVISVATARLRKALGQRRGGREYVENVYGRGYRFVRPVVTREPSTRPPPALLDGVAPEPPFVGRQRVLHRLGQALTEARGGRGRLCALIGEPGIGKTAAVEAFERSLQGTGTRVAWGFCHEHGDTPPLSPWQRALGPVLRELPPGALEESLGALAGALDPLSSAPSEGAGAQLEPPGPRARAQLFEAVARAVELAALHTPLVLVLDDLHRADAVSLELLAHLLNGLGRTQALVVATLRPPGAAGSRNPDLARAIGHRNCERILLEVLCAEDVAHYVGALLEDSDGALGRAVYRKSEGNPFFMSELARQLVDSEAPSPEELGVPDAAMDLIRQRLEALDAESVRALSAAAVLGRSFEVGVLQAVTDREPDALMSNLDAALGAEVLVAAPDSVTAFAFRHELMRIALYDGLQLAECRRLHSKAAHALHERRARGDDVAPSTLAFHAYRALPVGDPRRAVDACRLAAAAASRVYANAEVVRHLRHASQALDLMERPSARLRMALLQGILLHSRTTDPEAFERATREIVHLATEHGDGPSLVLAAAMLNPALGLEPEPMAEETYRLALSALPEGAAGLRAVSLAGLATTAPHCFDRAEVDRLLREATTLSRRAPSTAVDHGVLLAKAYLLGGAAHAPEAPEAHAAHAALESMARAHPRRVPLLPAELAYTRAVLATQRGDGAAALDAVERAIARYGELDQREGLWHAQRARLLLRIEAGQEPDGAAALSALHQRAEQQSLRRTAPFRAFDRVVVLPTLGRPAELDAGLQKVLAYDRCEPPSVWSMKVRALASAGWLDSAHESLRAVAASDLQALPRDRDHAGTLGHLGRAALLLGARDYLRALLPLLEPLAHLTCAHVSFHPEGTGAHVLGLLADALGRPGEAIEWLRRGAELDARAGLRRCAAEARERIERLSGAL